MLKEWKLLQNETNTELFKWYKEIQPGMEYLSAFGYPANCSLVERELSAQEEYDVLLSECYENRRNEYPPISDLADATFHKENGNSAPMESYLAAVQAVKTKYPKPTEPS